MKKNCKGCELRETILEIEKLKLKIHSFTCPRLHSDMVLSLAQEKLILERKREVLLNITAEELTP